MLEKYQTTTTSLKMPWVSFNYFTFLDLEKIQKQLNEKQYITREVFKRDLQKIFDNARTYNQEETIYYKYAN